MDWLCARSGALTVRAPTASRSVIFRGHTPHRVASGTAVKTSSGSSGVITFAKDAICTIGSGFGATSLITRYGGNSLFLLRSGVTACTLSRNTGAAPHYACGGSCNLVVQADGASFRTHSSNPIVIDGFQGRIRVRATDSSGTTGCDVTASGGTSNVRIAIHIKTTSTPNGVTIDISVDCEANINVGFTKTDIAAFQQQRQLLGLG